MRERERERETGLCSSQYMHISGSSAVYFPFLRHLSVYLSFFVSFTDYDGRIQRSDRSTFRLPFLTSSSVYVSFFASFTDYDGRIQRSDRAVLSVFPFLRHLLYTCLSLRLLQIMMDEFKVLTEAAYGSSFSVNNANQKTNQLSIKCVSLFFFSLSGFPSLSLSLFSSTHSLSISPVCVCMSLFSSSLYQASIKCIALSFSLFLYLALSLFFSPPLFLSLSLSLSLWV